MPPKTRAGKTISRATSKKGKLSGVKEKGEISFQAIKEVLQRPTFEQIVANSRKRGGYSRDKSYPARKASEVRITGKGTWAYLRKIIMYNEGDQSRFPATQFVLEKEYYSKKTGKKTKFHWTQTVRDLGSTIKQLQFLHEVIYNIHY